MPPSIGNFFNTYSSVEALYTNVPPSTSTVSLTSVRSVSFLEPVPPLDVNVIVFALVAFSMPPLPPMLTFMFDEV